MPRRKKKDENEMAFGVRAFTEQMAEETPTEKPKIDRAALRAAAKALSMLGASKGGKARAATLSPRRRKEIAQKAARGIMPLIFAMLSSPMIDLAEFADTAEAYLNNPTTGNRARLRLAILKVRGHKVREVKIKNPIKMWSPTHRPKWKPE